MQVVGYRTAVDDPAALVVRDVDDVDEVSLAPGRDLSYTLERRHCAGALTPDGHVTCDRDEAPYCPAHTSRWPCARCTGACDRPIDACREEHAVYLAAFAPATFKVGVTRSWRLETRLREQGADRAAHVHTVSDGRLARRLEADVAGEHGITDRVRVPTKVRGFADHVDDDAWDALLSSFRVVRRFDFSDVGPDLDVRPIPATMATGSVRGTKGRVLVLERGGTTYAVDMRDLVGYEVSTGPSARDRQATLTAFD